MIALIDYRAGNLTSVRKALRFVGAGVLDPAVPSDLRAASGLIVPGVGHFRATAALDDEWRGEIGRAVERGVPLLGICLGLQWLFGASVEAPELPGLGMMQGRCELIGSGELEADGPADQPPPRLRRSAGALAKAEAGRPMVKVPHVGWNALRIVRPSRLLAGVDDRTQVYFTHSYAAPVTTDCVATTTHGEAFAAAVERDGVFGVQFHPEKSAGAGLTILRNFLAAS